MNTEEVILQSAREIFYKKGLSGARMQEIADQAGINKAMLHYYFKTKEQLFNKVFSDALQIFSGKVAEILNGELSFEEKIRTYVNHTVDALVLDPGIPVFVLNELTNNPDRLVEMFAAKDKIDLGRFFQEVKQYSKGNANPEVLFMDMVALCVYPIVMSSVLKKLLKKTDQEYHELMEQRKVHIIDNILQQIS